MRFATRRRAGSNWPWSTGRVSCACWCATTDAASRARCCGRGSTDTGDWPVCASAPIESGRASRCGAAPERAPKSSCRCRPAWRSRRRRNVTAHSKIRVLSVDDHPLLREGIASIINNEPDMEMVAQAATGRDAIHQFREHRPDVTLMDLRLPDISGIDAMMAIRNEFRDARIVVLTTFEGDVEIQRALAAGARGYILKSMPPQELVGVVRQVHSGKKRIPPEVASRLAEHVSDESLTEREKDVLRHVAQGNRNRDIAERLFISEDTVKVHVKHIMEKLGANDRTEAVTIAVRRGIIEL